jgi:hypothetical protein
VVFINLLQLEVLFAESRRSCVYGNHHKFTIVIKGLCRMNTIIRCMSYMLLTSLFHSHGNGEPERNTHGQHVAACIPLTSSEELSGEMCKQRN